MNNEQLNNNPVNNLNLASYLSCPMGWEHFAGHCYLALDQVII